MSPLELIYKPEVTYSFLSEPDHIFKAIVGDIVAGTVGNPAFPDSQAKALLVESAFNDYAPTVVDRDKRNSVTAAQRVAMRTLLVKALKELLPAIQFEARGSLVALLSTNIPLARNPETPGLPDIPTDLQVFLFGEPQRLYVQCPKQHNAQMYTAQISRDRENWLWTASDTKSAVAFNNLPVGEKLYVQMQVKNSVGVSGWSTPVEFFIPPPGVLIPAYKRPKGVR